MTIPSTPTIGPAPDFCIGVAGAPSAISLPEIFAGLASTETISVPPVSTRLVRTVVASGRVWGDENRQILS